MVFDLVSISGYMFNSNSEFCDILDDVPHENEWLVSLNVFVYPLRMKSKLWCYPNDIFEAVVILGILPNLCMGNRPKSLRSTAHIWELLRKHNQSKSLWCDSLIRLTMGFHYSLVKSALCQNSVQYWSIRFWHTFDVLLPWEPQSFWALLKETMELW